jgi:hypothetical protein
VAPSDDHKWVSVILFLAALYNVAWGTLAALAPVKMLEALGVKAGTFSVELWQCIGMFVALYGVCYWVASNNPVRYWPFILVGLAGKVFGPAGAILAVLSGKLPGTFLWTNVTNDFLWWIPFTWALVVVRRWDREERAAADEHGITLYRRLIGPAFEDLTPNLRRFHAATEPVEVRGEFRVTRGKGAIGNWLTDAARFPRAQAALAVSLAVEQTAGCEVWRRSFAGTVIRSRQFEAHGMLAERFGLLIIYLRPAVVAGALEIRDVRSTCLGIPLPPWATPLVFARGIDCGAGVDVMVRISCSPLGLLVEYRGVVVQNLQ